ncbi:hypothetical protein B0A48_10126 [Cryoendolithus antarcticus]|uniref:Thioesterase domain-containing protein n=1 Tax=Cryoendolithus antarcticus TaxID=1507870 RepID=A0A1V8SX35_9PEZI|nr:hypothetical protein B0A48_10126 [Cryoendolithus antarcticus]
MASQSGLVTSKAATADSIAPFQRIPWTAKLLAQPDLVVRLPSSLVPKQTNEDSLFATTLRTPLTLRDLVSTYKQPPSAEAIISDVTTFCTLGNGMDGHPGLLHGGIIGTLIDEAMGILQTANFEREYARRLALGETPSKNMGSFTAYLNVQYLKPVRTGMAVVIVAKHVKREGRKDWITAEVKQAQSDQASPEESLVTCATGEGMFIGPKPSKL